MILKLGGTPKPKKELGLILVIDDDAAQSRPFVMIGLGVELTRSDSSQGDSLPFAR